MDAAFTLLQTSRERAERAQSPKRHGVLLDMVAMLAPR